MKIIDILNKIADETLEDGFKFKYYEKIYTYNKKYNRLVEGKNEDIYNFEEICNIPRDLNDAVEVIEEKEEILPICRETYLVTQDIEIYTLDRLIRHCENKINELVEAVNELKKEE